MKGLSKTEYTLWPQLLTVHLFNLVATLMEREMLKNCKLNYRTVVHVLKLHV